MTPQAIARSRAAALAIAVGLLTAFVAARVVAVSGGDIRADADSEARKNIEASLTSPRLDASSRAALSQKLDALNSEATARAAAPKGDVKAKQAAVPPPPEPTATPFTGIWDAANPPYPGWYAEASNAWSGPSSGGRVTVYAGHFTGEPRQAFLRVQRGSDTSAAITADVPLPRPTGPIRITGAEDGSLQISADDGSRWEFDLSNFTLSELP